MKKLLFIFGAIFMISGCSHNNVNSVVSSSSNSEYDTTDATNNFYDNTPVLKLEPTDLIVDGEIGNPGKVDFSKLEVHSVFVKETLLDSAGGDKFVGAYKYDGYSLFDILNRIILKKSNAKEFNPIIDLYIEVVNGKGDKVVFSWGEIYYPGNLNRIIIATGVSRIIPSKTKELWPLPEESKIVAGTDLITERNISKPVRITVKSFPHSFTVTKGMSPMHAKDFTLYEGDKKLETISPKVEKPLAYNTIFYGRGKGIHSTSPFRGVPLKDVIQKYYPFTRQNLKSGIVCLSALDGYRCVLSYSELFNRNDQQEFLLTRTKTDENGGLFRVFAAPDFFSDRAVKSLTGIYMIK
jgi:hypothetical protein